MRRQIFPQLPQNRCILNYTWNKGEKYFLSLSRRPLVRSRLSSPDKAAFVFDKGLEMWARTQHRPSSRDLIMAEDATDGKLNAERGEKEAQREGGNQSGLWRVILKEFSSQSSLHVKGQGCRIGCPPICLSLSRLHWGVWCPPALISNQRSPASECVVA